LYRSDWFKAMRAEGTVPVLFDPFCGSGTLPIEAALYATDTAPGIINPKRTFAFEKLPFHDAALWEGCKQEAIAKSEEGKKRPVKIFAWDVDKNAIRIAKENAAAAGMDSFITFGGRISRHVAEDVPAPLGYVVTDPPYGVRLDDNPSAFPCCTRRWGTSSPSVPWLDLLSCAVTSASSPTST
jgi:23S rRNA G2445 N2-methylase RlmL